MSFVWCFDVLHFYMANKRKVIISFMRCAPGWSLWKQTPYRGHPCPPLRPTVRCGAWGEAALSLPNSEPESYQPAQLQQKHYSCALAGSSLLVRCTKTTTARATKNIFLRIMYCYVFSLWRIPLTLAKLSK